MRINPKMYDIVTEDTKPLEVQELEGRTVEVYCLDDFPEAYNEFTGKGKFAVWSSVDGNNYRLFVEKVYKDEVKELYSKRVNEVWLKFWDDADSASKKTSTRVMIPISFIAALGLLLGSNFIGKDYQIYFLMAVFGTFLICLFTIKKLTERKIAKLNAEALSKVKKILGTKKFESLLEKQRSYVDEFYERKYPENELDDANSDTSENKEDNKDKEDLQNLEENNIEKEE